MICQGQQNFQNFSIVEASQLPRLPFCKEKVNIFCIFWDGGKVKRWGKGQALHWYLSHVLTNWTFVTRMVYFNENLGYCFQNTIPEHGKEHPFLEHPLPQGKFLKKCFLLRRWGGSLGWPPSHSIHSESSTVFVCPLSYPLSNFVTRLDLPAQFPQQQGHFVSRSCKTWER